jgi:hypothetical protein
LWTTSWPSSSRSSAVLHHTPSEPHRSFPKSTAGGGHKATTTFMDTRGWELKSQLSNSLICKIDSKICLQETCEASSVNN